MSHFHDPRSEQDLATVLAKRVAKSPEKPWIITKDNAYSYKYVDTSSWQLARGLTEAGVKQGDTVLLMLKDTIEYILAWCAISKIGAIEVPINSHYKGNLLSYVINDSDSQIMLVDAEYIERIEEISGKLQNLKKVFVLGNFEATNLSGFQILEYDKLYLESNCPIVYNPRPWDLMAIMYTSGTTGPSKGATITHSHAYEYAYGVMEMLELQESDIYYASLPLFHIAGQFALIYCSCIAGASAVLPSVFSAQNFWKDIRFYKATASFLLGAMANFLYAQKATRIDKKNSLERVLMVPLIPETEDFKARFDCLVSTTWGGTEMNCPMRSGFNLFDSNTCGRLAEDRYQVKIVDENDFEVPDGVAGEALVRAKEPWIISNGYWKHPEWTVEAWRNQWFHTGDMLKRDTMGNYYFVDRLKDAIRRRGENISSLEVENEINAHPDILESAVIPVESVDTEQEVMAVLVPKPGHEIDPENVIRFLEPRMAYFMVPRYLSISSELPKTPTGKIQKFSLRDKELGPDVWDRNHHGIKLKR